MQQQLQQHPLSTDDSFAQTYSERAYNEREYTEHEYAEQETDSQTIDEAINTSWDELKDSLYIYSICAQQHLKQYEAEAVRLTKAFHTHLNAQPEFTLDLKTPKRKNKDGNPWFLHNIKQDQYMSASLMAVYEDYTTPLHDYNNLAVISYILDGQIKLTRYQDQPTVISPYYPIARLVKTQEQFLTAGDIVITSPNSGNISEIQSLTDKSVILNIHLIKSCSELGAWYFPISPKPTEYHEVFFAQRIRRSM